MKYANIWLSPINASVIGLGTLPMGGWNKGNKWGSVNFRESVKVIHAAVESGINFIDDIL